MKRPAGRGFLRALRPFLAVSLGLAVGMCVVAAMGESPLHVISILIKSAIGSRYDLGMTLFYATPLALTGTAVAVAFRAGLFNIGAEGQLQVGAMAAASVGLLYPSAPWPLAPILATLAAFCGGAAWGAIPGWLKAKRGSHEVINTIMLNFVASGLCSYVTLQLFRNSETQNPETARIGAGYLLHRFAFFGDAPVTVAVALAILVVWGYGLFISRTVAGFELRAQGENPLAARAAGIRSGRTQILAMTLAGGIAGLVGVAEVLGNSGKFKLGFSPDYGFIGIAVALLGRGSPLGVLGAALLFGGLHKGTADLDLETEKVTRDLSLVLQAFIILSVAADAIWEWYERKVSRD